jgi:NADH-quinone oxidoreductase subunit H
MQQFLETLHNTIVTLIAPAAGNVPINLIYAGGLLVASVVVLVWMSLVAMLWIYLERRVAGWIQARRGPNRVGPFGILQSLADGIKLIGKEDVIPAKANRFMYELAPVLVMAGAVIPFAVLPFSRNLVIADMDLGLFYVLGFAALEVVGVLMAGWAPNSKWSLYGGMRLAAQMLSYEIPLGLSVLVIVVLSGTLNLTEIVEWQTRGIAFFDGFETPWRIDALDWEPLGFIHWGLFRAPWVTIPAFLILLCASLAETKRAPFDLPEAESELVSGFHTEYTGIRFSYFFLAEYAAMYVVAALIAVTYLGGWYWPLPTPDLGSSGILVSISEGLSGIRYEGLGFWGSIGLFLKSVFVTGPVVTFGAIFEPHALKVIGAELAGFINLVGKAFALLFFMLWIRWTIPRVRIDQVMHLCLKVLLPIALGCLLVAAVQAAFTKPAPPREPVSRPAAAATVPTVEAPGEETAAE